MTAHFPTDNEIRDAARQLLDGGYNDVDPEKTALADRLMETAGSGNNRQHVLRRIADATIELEADGGS